MGEISEIGKLFTIIGAPVGKMSEEISFAQKMHILQEIIIMAEDFEKSGQMTPTRRKVLDRSLKKKVE